MRKRNRRIRLTAVLLAVVMAMSFLLSSCGTEGAPQSAAKQPAEDETIFTDSWDREVIVPKEITRIVPSGPLAQIVLYALAPDMFVGLASRWDDSARGIIADEYFDLPYFGSLYGGRDLNIEELAKVDPQLIIDVGESKSSGSEDMDMLQEQSGIPSVFIDASLETMPETYRTLGKLLGKEERAEELASFCEKTYAQTQRIMEQVGDNKVDTLYVMGEDGLNVMAKGAYHAEVIDLVTNNLAVVDNPSSRGSGNEVTMEQVAIWDPDFILFGDGSIYADVREKGTWKDLEAIKNGRYLEVPAVPHNWMGSPPSVQRYLGMIWLTAALYPDYCDYDVKEEIKEYYRLFYGCELSDETYADLTKNAFFQ